MSVEEEFVKP